MFGRQTRAARQLEAARALIKRLAPRLNGRASIQLWDGSKIPLGTATDPNLCVSFSGPEVIASMLRRPTPANLLRHFARGHIDFHGADLHTVIQSLRDSAIERQGTPVGKLEVIRALMPFLFQSSSAATIDHEFKGEVTGRARKQIENVDFVQFHYDLSNEFYELFLDERMVYTCGYFTADDNTLDQAQLNKLDITCRKLRLRPGERFLDIGFGWGGLLFHAARHYGVQAHGITLSQNQKAYVDRKSHELGLADRVTVEVCDYADLQGQYDKVASICMYEHVGISNIPSFMKKVNSLMSPHGLFLLQGITRPGKANMKQFRRLNPERRLLAKHIFPGAELDHLGHMIQSMESGGFEVSDVEGWRNHYIRTCAMWCRRLYDRREEASRLVGEEACRLYQLYLAGCSLAFQNGGARLYQVLAEKHVRRTGSSLPLTRSELYADDDEAQRLAG